MNLKPRPKTELSLFAQIALGSVANAWFPVTPEEILGPSRPLWVADARNAFCAVLKAYHMPTPKIAGFTGRSISAVDHSIRAARSLVSTDPQYRERYQTVMQRLSGHRTK